MKILVCISSVPDTTTKITFADGNTKFNTAGVQFVINPYDEFGLSRAMQLKETLGGNVTTITVGRADTEPVIRKALAIGADDAVRIDADPMDSLQVATEIANYAKDKGFDLIITGRESIDYNGGAVPGMLAELLGINSVSPCVKLDIDGTTATMQTLIDGGKEVVKSSLPLVAAAQKGMVEESELRIPNMRGIMAARTKPLAVVPGTAAGNAKFKTFDLPAPKAACKMVSADNVEELVHLLHTEAKVI
jgi:electron transfer flavoprotein beta subunit